MPWFKKEKSMLYTSVFTWVANSKHSSSTWYSEHWITLNVFYFSFENSEALSLFKGSGPLLAASVITVITVLQNRCYRTLSVNRILGNRELLAFLLLWSSFSLSIHLSIIHPFIHLSIHPLLIHQALVISSSQSSCSSLFGTQMWNIFWSIDRLPVWIALSRPWRWVCLELQKEERLWREAEAL